MQIKIRRDDGTELTLSAAEIMRAYWLLIDARIREYLQNKQETK